MARDDLFGLLYELHDADKQIRDEHDRMRNIKEELARLRDERDAINGHAMAIVRAATIPEGAVIRGPRETLWAVRLGCLDQLVSISATSAAFARRVEPEPEVAPPVVDGDLIDVECEADEPAPVPADDIHLAFEPEATPGPRVLISDDAGIRLGYESA